MESERIAVLPGPLTPNEIKDLECQTGATAHTEPKGQIGEVSNRVGGWRAHLEIVRDKLAGKVSPTLSRQEARKLMREVARNAAAVEKLQARKPGRLRRAAR